MKKLAGFILVLALVLAIVPASLAEGERIALICDPVGNNLFLTQVVEKAEELQAKYGSFLFIVLTLNDRKNMLFESGLFACARAGRRRAAHDQALRLRLFSRLSGTRAAAESVDAACNIMVK